MKRPRLGERAQGAKGLLPAYTQGERGSFQPVSCGWGGLSGSGMWEKEGTELPNNLLFHKPGRSMGSGDPGSAWGCR